MKNSSYIKQSKPNREQRSKSLGVTFQDLRGVLVRRDSNSESVEFKQSTKLLGDDDELSGLLSFSTIHYHGVGIEVAAKNGQLPVFVLLWTIAISKKTNLLVSDSEGNSLLHYAAQADDSEVLMFILQRSKGCKINNIPLVNLPNNDGDTPLMIAISRGNIPVVQTLIKSNCDLFEINKSGLNIFCKSAKYGHLWLLHYLYVYISELCDRDVAMKMLRHKDIDCHGVLEWGAYSGNVQLIEYLIRKGIDPRVQDNMGRDALYWAIKSGDAFAAKFLVMFGLDPGMQDKEGQSPLSIALENKNDALIRALIGDVKTRLFNQIKSIFISKLNGYEVTDIECQDADELWKKCYTKDMKSHAIYNHKYVRINYLLFFTLFFSTFWFLAICFTFYSFLIVCIVLLLVYYYGLQRLKHKQKVNNSITNSKLLSMFEEAVQAPEKFIGVWFCGIGAGIVYLLSCYLVRNEYNRFDKDMSINDMSMLSTATTFLIMAGTGAAADYPGFFLFCVVSTSICFISFIAMIFWKRDPGIVDTRATDFMEVMDNSFQNLGPPSHELYCRTTMCRKPLRAKYCVITGALVARMDHYCIYLNNCIGYGNHRIFVIFLLIQFETFLSITILMIVSIANDFAGKDSCYMTLTIFTRHYWFDVSLGFTYAIISLSVLGLLVEQCWGIFKNITINERMNSKKYPWYLYIGEDKVVNPFDKGWICNLQDFWRVRNYNDYYNIYNNDSNSVHKTSRRGSTLSINSSTDISVTSRSSDSSELRGGADVPNEIESESD